MTKKPQINCMFDFYGIDVSDVVDETIKNGICVAQVGKNCGKDRKFYIRSFDDSPSGFVVCVREHDHTPGYLVETIYPHI